MKDTFYSFHVQFDFLTVNFIIFQKEKAVRCVAWHYATGFTLYVFAWPCAWDFYLNPSSLQAPGDLTFGTKVLENLL